MGESATQGSGGGERAPGGIPTGRRGGGSLTPQTRELLALARDEVLRFGDADRALRHITEAAARALQVERVGVWLYDEARTSIRCADLHVRSAGTHSSGPCLSAADYPAYFEALEGERVISAHDAVEDPRTCEFAESYLEPHGISSMLDAPIRLGGVMQGVVCHEHVGPRRIWSAEDRAFAGSMADFVALALEAAERRQAEEALRESEERVRLVMNSTAEGIFGIDAQGRCTFCNASGLRALGHDAEDELLGRSMHSRLHRHGAGADPRESAECRVLRTAGAGEPVHVADDVFFRRDGTSFPVEYHVQPIRRGTRLVGSVVTFLDVEGRREAEAHRRALEEQIQHAQKMESLANLAGGVAHDFNNMLMAVLGNASLALEDLREGSAAHEHVRQVETAALRAADLAQQLLAYSGRGRFHLEGADIAAIVREMTHLLESSLSPNARLELNLDEGLPLVEADATQLRQVFMNLILNASESLGDEEGSVSVAACRRVVDAALSGGGWLPEPPAAGEHVCVTVTDTGAGMDAETRARVFEPFFTTKTAGRGLGLAAVLGIVRGHRGSIRVASKPDRGTTFEVVLPAAPTAVAAQRAAAPSRPTGSSAARGAILVADDDPSVRAVARRMLERSGYSVLEAADGEAAVAEVDRRGDELALVLLDLTMPKLGGEAACREILRRCPHLRVLVSSGYPEQAVVERFGDVRPSGFIQKPYLPSALVAKVAELLEG